MAKDLSKHPTKGFRLSLSYYVTPAGKRSPKVFWLGHREREALDLADLIRYAHREMFGGADWTDESLVMVKKGVERLREGSRNFLRTAIRTAEDAGLRVLEGPKPTPEAKAVFTSEPLAGKTLYSAIAAYLAALKGKRKSDSHKWRAEQVLNGNLKNARADCPLEAIDFGWLDTFADEMKARPIGRRGKGKNKKQISPRTVKVILQYCRAFFVWMDDTSYGGWVGPRKLTKPFKVTLDEIRTAAEVRQSVQIEQFEISTLVVLYAHASDFGRRCMLLGLFAGLTQTEISVLEKEEFDLSTGMLKHMRNKTKVEGSFWLPPELVNMLKADFAKRPNDVLAVRSPEGLPVIQFADGKKTNDAVRQMWESTRDRAKMPTALSFRFLRKFLADYVVEAGGEELGQVALAHSSKTVLGKHYSSRRNFAAFHKIQRKLHEELTAAKMFDAGLRQ